jgi:hypothetical protein
MAGTPAHAFSVIAAHSLKAFIDGNGGGKA